jgi:hypothetical protein
MFPYSERSVGETMLYSSLFGSGYFAVSANGLAKSRYVVCSDFELESEAIGFLKPESSDVQPQPTVGAACDAIIEPVGSACNAADEPFGSASAAAVDNMATVGVAVANIDNDVSCAAVIPDDIGNDTVVVDNFVTAGVEPLNVSVPAGQEPTGVSVPAGQKPVDDSKFYNSHTFITCPGGVMNQESTWLLPSWPPDAG